MPIAPDSDGSGEVVPPSLGVDRGANAGARADDLALIRRPPRFEPASKFFPSGLVGTFQNVAETGPSVVPLVVAASALDVTICDTSGLRQSRRVSS